MNTRFLKLNYSVLDKGNLSAFFMPVKKQNLWHTETIILLEIQFTDKFGINA